ncbi:MAG: cobalamin biosynthesis protein CobD [Proteobacteria bacterium]|nr:cobalamin biosynthesis protein CobD [Pseudomonadota bacterium]
MDWYSAWYILPSAFVLDLILGDPRYLPHPIRWMGKAIVTWEFNFRKIPSNLTVSGALFAASLVTGTWLLTYLLLVAVNSIHPILKNCFEIILIYYCISASSLEKAALEIRHYLENKNITGARKKVALIVGRDVTNYQETDIARATVESVAENLVDGVISPLFFAAIGGAPLAMAYKMVNTLDSMVGYKNEKYLNFGQTAARIDDVLNYIPTRLALPIISLATHILSGKGARSLKTAVREGANHSSPNAGFPEAAFAGALSVKLNGPNFYNGKRVDKPFIGIRFGNTSTEHIKKACDIMLLSSFFWLLIVWTLSLLLN